MFREIIDRLKEAFDYILKSRLVVLIVVFCLTSSALIGRLFYLQIVKGEYYLENYELQIRKTRQIDATRGNIYDRNGNLLAYNELAYSVTIEDTVSRDVSSEEKNKIINGILDRVLTIVEANGDSVIDSFGIILDSSGNYQFAETNETRRLRFVADVYGERYTDDLTEERKTQSAGELIHYLCTERYGIDDEANDPAYVLKMVNMRYAMGLNSYTQYLTTTLASDVSDKTAAAIMENQASLTGVDIEEDSLRRYVDGEYFASIIGYTGQISQEEYDALDEDVRERYSLSDVVGKSGIEQAFDTVLQGEKGKTTFYVDNLGKVIDTVSSTDPKAGNDVYLTIDKNIQMAAYNLLEEKLAGIVLSKLRNILDYDPANAGGAENIIIPAGDAYYAFIANGITDMNHLGSAEAGSAEKAIYAAFTQKRESTLNELKSQLENPNAPAYRDLSKEMQAYMDYVCDTVLKEYTGVLLSDQIDSEDETQIAWAKEETISLYMYLNYAISQNWIDTSKLEGGTYSSSDEIYQSLVAYLQEYLSEDSNFDKLLYKYLIKSGSITGNQICAAAYEQGNVPMDEDTYNNLISGATDAYYWLYSKIQSLEITPGQLGLEPCSGGIVVTDPNSGNVLACVSYPGYDNNRLANTMDSAYYNQLNTGLARIFYNRATQELTAPGSTYKMVSSTAGLEEGVISTDSAIYCSGIFETVTPNPKCWIYPNGGHGSLNVVQAIRHSCNVFFYQVGYDLSIDQDGNYDSDLGTDRLGKYASLYGLGEKSGLEIPEAEPHLSDEYSIQSAIGQGNNSFTVSQLNRYVTAVANSGTVYDLTLIDKTTDANGKLIKDYEAEVVNDISGEISSTTWEAIHEGMRQMAATSSVFAGIDFSMAGKTGTAQHNDQHADHVLFVGYAPAESPELSVAVRITYGYNSGYSAEIGRDIAKVYFNPEAVNEVVTGQAAQLGTGIEGD